MRLLKRLIVVFISLSVVLSAAGYLVLRASLARLDGELAVDSLGDAVGIERDRLGVVTITAATRTDAAFATGFVHAQERFFQMDLQRRAAAGELSALFGARALAPDKASRLHRFRHRARQMIDELSAADAGLYRAYSDGVNAGLAALGARPFEYWLLRQKPEPWLPEDILLTVFSMYFELHDEDASRESELGVLKALLAPGAYRWLIQSGTDWDAPLRGGIVDAAPLPGPQALDLRKLPPQLFVATPAAERDPAAPGSNNWAVSAARSATGRALLAGDMHLGHAVPNIWFRVRLIVAGDELDISGASLPGTPLIVAGSNRHVAWSFTNTYGDWEELIVLETDPARPNRYRTPSGWLQWTEAIESIEVAGGATVAWPVRETVWGPVIDEDFRGRPRALRWLPHLPAATNAGIVHFERAGNVDEAIAAANRVGGPPQNYVVADAAGRIGWTIMGRIPQRDGYDPAVPASWADGAGWHGWVARQDYPRIVDPAEGIIWTANARTVDGDWLALLGEGNHPLGARPRQIRDGLRARATLTLEDMLAIQLDDRAVFLERWRELLLQILTPEVVAERPARGELRDLVEHWGGRAAVDSAGYRLVRAFRLDAIQSVTSALLAGVRAQVPDFELTGHSQLERPVWQAIRERPAHLLNPAYDSWDAYLVSIVDTTIDYFRDFDGTLADRTWGELNTTRIAHPLSAGLPALSRWLNMPARPLPGDTHMPRVQGRAFGASQRMAVSPGHEQTGYFHMPGGQSGHPLSPFYDAGHGDWVEGEPTPFLPGETAHRLVLQPSSRGDGIRPR